MLLATIQSDLITAMKAGDKPKVETLRYLIAAVKKFEIDAYPPTSDKKLSEEDVDKIIQKQIKTHRESIEAFSKAKRTELVAKETAELAILQSYIPKELTDDEIKAIISEVKASGTANFGQVMGMVMKKIAGRADGNRVATFVKAAFSK